MSLLEVQGVTVGYGDVPVLTGVSLDVDTNETVVIIGPNGAGKSTLLKCIVGLLPLRAGQIKFEGRDCVEISPEKRPGIGMTYVPQSSNVFASLSVAENLELALPRGTKKRHFESRVAAIGD